MVLNLIPGSIGSCRVTYGSASPTAKPRPHGESELLTTFLGIFQGTTGGASQPEGPVWAFLMGLTTPARHPRDSHRSAQRRFRASSTLTVSWQQAETFFCREMVSIMYSFQSSYLYLGSDRLPGVYKAIQQTFWGWNMWDSCPCTGSEKQMNHLHPGHTTLRTPFQVL